VQRDYRKNYITKSYSRMIGRFEKLIFFLEVNVNIILFHKHNVIQNV